MKPSETKKYKRMCKEFGVNPEDYDVNARFDSSLRASENWKNIERDLREMGENPRPETNNEEYEEYLKEHIENHKQKDVDLSGFYSRIYREIEKIRMGYSSLLFVKGSGGTGKSFNIKKALEKKSMKYIEIHKITEAILPEVMYNNQDKVIWVKDCIKLFNNPMMIEILKSATETVKGKDGKYMPRKISIYNYSNELKKAGVPKEFHFNGAFIFDFNNIVNLHYYEDFDALVSRGNLVQLVFSGGEMKNILNKVADNDWKKEVTEFLINNHVFVGRNRLNLRTQQKAFDTYLFAKQKGTDWRRMLYEELKAGRSKINSMLYQVMGEKPMKTKELKRYLIEMNICNTMRTADRRINEYMEMEELFRVSNGERNFYVSLFKISDK